MKEFQDLKDSIRTVPNYPVEGVQFRDITTLLQDAGLFKKMIDGMTKQWESVPIDAILSIESRGFIMAGALAYNLGLHLFLSGNQKNYPMIHIQFPMTLSMAPLICIFMLMR